MEDKEKGVTVEMRDGPTLIFGDATRVRDKWDAAARVLADPAARGAAYIDLRLPDRPAAGGVAAETVAPVAPAGGVAEPAAPEQAPTATTPEPATDPTTTAPAAEQATPVVPAPAEQGPTQPQQQPPAAVQPQQGTAGGGAAVEPQP